MTNKKIMIQSDFDGTLIKDDISILILDHFAGDKWHPIYDEYTAGRVGLDEFNSTAFRMVNTTPKEFLDYSKETMKIKDGCKELIETCQELGIRFHIVSNGILDYVNLFKELIGHPEIEAAASKVTYEKGYMNAWYENPYGERILEDFKYSYTEFFKKEGYKIIYLGDGSSDFKSSQHSDLVFATHSLESIYKEKGLEYIPFQDLYDVANYLKYKIRL